MLCYDINRNSKVRWKNAEMADFPSSLWIQLVRDFQVRGKNLPIAHPVLTRITTATEEPFVSVPNCSLLRLASRNVSQVPPRLVLTALQGEGSYGEGWESPLLPWGEAGGSGEGSSGQRGSAPLAAQSPVWDEQSSGSRAEVRDSTAARV